MSITLDAPVSAPADLRRPLGAFDQPAAGELLPTVSIIIPAFNEQAVIERCVRAALAQIVPAHEIIVVDNRSSDRTAEIVRGIVASSTSAPIRLVRQDDSQGLVPTRNAGFDSATGDVLGRIDADSVIDPDWVWCVADRMRDLRVGAVTGPVSYYDLPHAKAGRIVDDLTRRALRRLGTRYPFLYGSNMALRASAWAEIKENACTDDDDQMHEDIDLAVHLYEAGIRAVYSSKMRAGVSARRMNDSPTAFREYTARFERTYRRHQVDHWYLHAPRIILEGLYWPVHLSRTMRSHRRAVLA